MFLIFSGILIDEQIFFSPQVKRSVVISNKHGIYELPFEQLISNDEAIKRQKMELG